MYECFIPFHGSVLLPYMDIFHISFVHFSADGYLGTLHFWLFCVVLPWAFMYKFLCEHVFLLLLRMYLCVYVCISSIQLLSRVRLCDPMDFRTPGLPVHHQLPELAQTQMHRVGDAIQPSHPLSSPSPPAFPMSQLFTCGGQSIGGSASVSVPLMNIQCWFPLGLTGLISLQSKGLSRVFSNTTVQKHQFFGTQLSLWSNSHNHTWLLEKP